MEDQRPLPSLAASPLTPGAWSLRQDTKLKTKNSAVAGEAGPLLREAVVCPAPAGWAEASGVGRLVVSFRSGFPSREQREPALRWDTADPAEICSRKPLRRFLRSRNSAEAGAPPVRAEGRPPYSPRRPDAGFPPPLKWEGFRGPREWVG